MVDATQFVAGYQGAAVATQRLGTAAVSSHRALTIIKGGLLSIASTAAAVPGPIGHISAALAGLGLSTGGLLAILGILASAALLFKKLGDAAQLAADNVVAAQDRMRKNLASFVGAHAEEGAPSVEGLRALRASLKEAQDRLAQMQSGGSLIGAGGKLQTFVPGDIEAQVNAIRRIEQSIYDLQHALHELRVKELQQAAFDAAIFAKEWAKVNTALEVTASKVLVPLRSKLGLDQMAKGPGKGAVDLLLPGEAELLRLNEADRNRLNNLGSSIGRTIMYGVLEGMQSMQEIMKSIFFQLLEYALGGFLKGVLGPLGGGGAGGKSLSSLTKSVPVPAASMSLNMNMGGLQPLTVFAISRDPGFQQVIRESILVAASQGFRGA